MYITSRALLCLSDSGVKTPHFFVHDAMSRRADGQKILERYLADACEIFELEMHKLHDTSKPFRVSDEEHLSRMFALLLDARKAWQEEEDKVESHFI